MSIVDRNIQSFVVDALGSFPAVYINGPRQAGKTTLVRALMPQTFEAKFITFDDALERASAMRNPMLYLKELGTPLIIDEVQMVQALFRPLKMRIDEQRYISLKGEGTANSHYLLTGSANLMAIPALADAMVGRMATLTLLPLSTSEVLGQESRFLERCWAKDFSTIQAGDGLPLIQAIEQASFPELKSIPEKMVDGWFKNYVQKITLEDPHYIYNLEKAEYMPILLQSLAARAGSLINDANIGREVGLNAVTARHYRSLLNYTFVTYRLRPWYRNLTKRLVKSDKLYFYDTMLLCHLLGSSPAVLAKEQPQRFGHVLENFVLSELVKANHMAGESFHISFYRTNDGRAVDFVLERGQKLIAIEVKYAENITEKDLLGIKELQQVAGDDFHCGIILCNTPRVISFDQDIYLIPFAALWQ